VLLVIVRFVGRGVERIVVREDVRVVVEFAVRRGENKAASLAYHFFFANYIHRHFDHY